MHNDKKIYILAEKLIAEHGKAAEDFAMKRMHALMQQNDAKEASFWLAVMQAIHDFDQLQNKNTLN